MKKLTQKLLALLLVACMFACMIPAVSAADLPVSKIDLAIDQIHTTEGYELVYYAELSMDEAMASYVTLVKEKWGILSQFRFTCTLTDELTPLLTAENTPEFYFESSKLNGEDIFVPVSSTLDKGSLVLMYKLNPAMEEGFARASSRQVRSALCGLMYMQANPGFVSNESIGSLKELNTKATIHLTNANRDLLLGYGTARALLAEGTLKTTLDEKLTFTSSTVEETGIDRLIDTKNHGWILQGYPEGTFLPARQFTRAEAAVTLYRLLLPEVKASVNLATAPTFSDVKSNAWYATEVRTLAALGIIKGKGGNKFEPNQPISRADFAIILSRFANPAASEAYPADFSDVPKTHYAYKEIMTAATYGWVAGSGENKFNPSKNITRAEASKMFCMFLDRRPDRFAIRRGEFKQYSDLDPSFWAYNYIIEVSTPHEYQRIGNFEVWTDIG